VVKCPKCHVKKQDRKWMTVCQVKLKNPRWQRLAPFLIESIRFSRPNDMDFCEEVEVKPDFYAPTDPIQLEHLCYEPADIKIQVNFRKELVELMQSEVMAEKDLDDVKRGNTYVFKSRSINSNATETLRVAPIAMNTATQMYEKWKNGQEQQAADLDS